MLLAWATESFRSPTALAKFSKIDAIGRFAVEAPEFEVEIANARS